MGFKVKLKASDFDEGGISRVVGADRGAVVLVLGERQKHLSNHTWNENKFSPSNPSDRELSSNVKGSGRRGDRGGLMPWVRVEKKGYTCSRLV